MQEDVGMAEDTYGPSVPHLQGKHPTKMSIM